MIQSILAWNNIANSYNHSEKHDKLKGWITIAMAFIKLWSMACGKMNLLATQLIYLFFVRSRCYDESSTRDYCTCHITHCWVPLGCPSKIQKVTLGRKVGSLRMRNVFKGKIYKNRSMFGMKYDIVQLLIIVLCIKLLLI